MVLRLLIKTPYYLSLIFVVGIVMFHIQDGGITFLVNTAAMAMTWGGGLLMLLLSILTALWYVWIWLLFAGLHRWVLKQWPFPISLLFSYR